MPKEYVKETPQGAVLMVMAAPRSSKTEIVEIQQDRVKIKVKAPPVDGEANSALVEYLSKTFKIPKKSVILEKGQTGKQKSFLLVGLTQVQVCQTIEAILSGKGK